MILCPAANWKRGFSHKSPPGRIKWVDISSIERMIPLPTLLLILLPLFGTSLGAAFVIPRTKKTPPVTVLNGFAAGVMTAASVWSLLLPAIEQSQDLGVFSFFPAFCGLWLGVLFLKILEQRMIFSSSSMLSFAVALHNLPEGMAVGAAITAWHHGDLSWTGCFALSLGIAIQNLPEGAIISLPLAADGTSRSKALGAGILSGMIEPMGALLTMLLAESVLPALPYLLGFSAGAMLYVVVTELITGDRCGIWFTAGFSLMMLLDVALG